MLPLTVRMLEYPDLVVIRRPRFASGRAVSASSSIHCARIRSAMGDVDGGEDEAGGTEFTDGPVRACPIIAEKYRNCEESERRAGRDRQTKDQCKETRRRGVKESGIAKRGFGVLGGSPKRTTLAVAPGW